MPTCSHCSSSYTSVSPCAQCVTFRLTRYHIGVGNVQGLPWSKTGHLTSATNLYFSNWHLAPTHASYPEAKATLLQLTEKCWWFVNLGSIHPLVWFRILHLVSLDAWSPVSRVTGGPMILHSVSVTNPLFILFKVKFILGRMKSSVGEKSKSFFTSQSHFWAPPKN